MNTINPYDRPRFAFLLAALLLSSAGVFAAEGESTHPLWPAYERAAAAQAHLEDRWMLNQAVHPRWLDGSTFWYERETPEGKEYTLVDARLGEKRPAFDHGALAAALAEETGQEMDASALPIVGRRDRTRCRDLHERRAVLSVRRRRAHGAGRQS